MAKTETIQMVVLEHDVILGSSYVLKDVEVEIEEGIEVSDDTIAQYP